MDLRRRAVLFACSLFLAASPALADPTPGTYRTQGTHSALGAFTGEVTLEGGGASGYRLRGEYRFSGGRVLRYTGTGRLAGDHLNVDLTYEAPGVASVIDPNGSTVRREARGSYAFDGQGHLTRGRWRAKSAPRHRVRETLSLASAPTTPTTPAAGPAKVDLQVVRDGQGVDESWVAMNIDDDDQDGGRAGDGDTKVVRDMDDPNGTPGEDDLVEVRIASLEGASQGATLRFTYGADLALYRGKDRTGRLASGDAVAAATGSFFVEGRTASGAGGDALAVDVVSGGQVVGHDAVTIHVAHAAFLLCGHGCAARWSTTSLCRERALDQRSNPTFVRGKGEDGAPAYWSVFVWDTEKGAKIALSTPGAVIAYDGHSNFGMGFAFATNFSRLSQFMNIADPQIPVNWPYLRDHQEHPQLMFDDSEYGDDAATSATFDPVLTTSVVDTATGPMRKSRWPLSGGEGQRYPLVRGQHRWEDHHYDLGGDDNIRIVVKAGSKDMPEKRWSKLFLNSCYSGSYYYDSFGGHGTLFFTTDEASASTTSGAFLFGVIDGKTDDQVLAELNQIENINSYKVFTND
jgi:hypothetical protein